ncbi:unnamed protein product [Meganyctiphanes norvegica]|uniref:AIG1-type G domain-containing protein n=1 Tax=Meganyctiphanes norvegica TaxID=48144 RepID=A0AAV2REF1_MEGNR
MERTSGGREVHVSKDVQLGWIYDSTSREFCPPVASREYRYKDSPSFEWNIYNKSVLNRNISSKMYSSHSHWIKDFQDSHAQEIFHITGTKLIEKIATEDIVNSSDQDVVSTLCYKSYVYLLLFYDCHVPESFEEDMKTILNDIIFDVKQVILPPSINNGSRGLNLYDISKATPFSLIAGLKEACRQLKAKEATKQCSVIVSNGKVHKGEYTLSKGNGMVKEFESSTRISSHTKYTNVVTVSSLPSYAQITSNLTENSTVKVNITLSSNSSNQGSLNSMPAGIHLPTASSHKTNNEIISQMKCDEEKQTREFKSQPKNSLKNERSHSSQRTLVHGIHDDSEIDRSQTSYRSNSNHSQDVEKNGKQAPRDRSSSCRRGSSQDRRETQNSSTTRARSSSRGRKVTQEQKVNNDIHPQSSYSSSAIRRIETVQTALSSGGNGSMPPIRSILVPRSTNSNSRDDNSKHVNIAATNVSQKSNAIVGQYKNASQSYLDQNSLISDHHKCNDNVISHNKTSNANLTKNHYLSGSSKNIASNSLNPNERGSLNSHDKKYITTDTQKSSDIAKVEKTSLYSGNSLNNTHSIFKKLEPSRIVVDPCGMKRQYYGIFSSNIEEKVILLLGASGSGKTTLVNFVANFFRGVKTPDEEKMIVAPTSVKTKEITAYTFWTEKDAGTAITIIDTPGLNDSSGSEIRDHVNSLKTFLANTAAHDLKIHALGFVAQAHLVRLTSSERLVMDYVSTLFGEGVKDNIITLISFADVQENPPVVEAMKNYGIKTKHFLKFNNAVLNGSSDEVDDLDRVYWRTGYKSWKKGMKILNELLPLSINAMKTLQNEVYTKSVVESSLKDFNIELIEFLSIYRQGDLNSIRRSSLQIWDLATIAHHHLRNTPEGSTSIENLLVTSVESICCQQQSHNSAAFLRGLSFYSPRGLDVCADAIINSIHPVYCSAKNMQNTKANKSNAQCKSKKQKWNVNSLQANNHEQELIFCHQCQKDHIMERLDEATIMEYAKKFMGYKQHPIVTFRCTECKCDGNMHGVNLMLNSGGIHNNFGLDINRILHHTTNMLSKLVEKHSLPTSNMTEKDLIKFVMKEANVETNTFLNAILDI